MTPRKFVRKPTTKESPPRPTSKATPGASGYGKSLFAIIERQLKASSNRRTYIPPKQIARALKANPGIPLPPEIHEYLCDFFAGKIPAPTGRPADFKKPLLQIKKALIPPTYACYLAWLKQRKQSMGLKGWKQIQNADWWQGPPSERAARMTQFRLVLAISWRRVQNIVSEAKKNH